MELVKKDPIERISAQYRPYIEALRTQVINPKNRALDLKFIHDAIVLATEYNNQGSKNSEQAQVNKFLAESIYEEIRVKFHFIRHGEILLAFKKGALGEYGQFFGVNVKTLYGWIKSYFESRECKDAKIEWSRLMDEEMGVVRVEKPKGALAMTDEQILNLYNEWLEGKLLTGDLPRMYSRICYDEICKRKGVKTLLTEEQRKSIEPMALKEYDNQLKKEKQHIKNKEIYHILLKACEPGTATFATIGKKIALRMYFQTCKEKNIKPI